MTIIYITFCMVTLLFEMSLTDSYFTKHQQKKSLTFYGTYRSRSMLDCGAICSLDDECLSLSFNNGTDECLLSKTTVFTIQGNWIVDVNWQTLTNIVKTIGNPCSNDADCLETNSICLGGICFCNSTTKYNKVICSCDKECSDYASTFTVYENTAISGYNHYSLEDVTLEECQQACIDMGNTCGSVDYDASDQLCFPQTATYQQVSEADPSAFYSSSVFTIYSRHC